MATNGSKAALPPRTLNVQKFAESRASELEALHSIVTDRLNNDFQSQRNKRRRTTGYDNRVARNRWKKRQKVGFDDKKNASDLEKYQKKVPRRIRRRVELRKNPENGYLMSGDGTKRLRTHVWHAKRFKMTKLWGFHLPLCLQGRGRGSRALLKRFKHGALIHDASYYTAVQLEGPEDSLLSVLSMVLVPFPSAHFEDISSILSGVAYGSAILHHIGAPVSQPIAPVTYMWRPFSQHIVQMDAHDCNLDGYSEPREIENSSFRQFWAWLHASAFNEGYDTLKLACQKQMDESGILIDCFSREGQLARLEVMGEKAFQLLEKTLDPAVVSENSSQQKKCSVQGTGTKSEIKKYFVFGNEEDTSSHAIISLTVRDPRSFSEVSVVPMGTSINHVGDVQEKGAKEPYAFTGSPNSNNDSFSSLDLKPKNDRFSDSELWDVSNGLSPPVEESVLCMEKHCRRLEFFCLDKNSSMPNSWMMAQRSRMCPILLLKANDQKGSIMGWSIILPLSWVKAFWGPLVANGAHPIGLTEKHWVACDVGLPYFPVDFPDCNAYSCFMANKAAASDEKLKNRPPSVRPFRIPIPSPWDSIQFSFEKRFTRAGDTDPWEKNLHGEVNSNSLTNSNSGNCNATLVHHCTSFEGFVARKADMLTLFLNEIHGDDLFLFPKQSDRKMSNFQFMTNEGKLCLVPNGLTQKIYERKLCFLRVLLHACKEGVFEEGAIVCAPHLTDISLWTSRFGDNESGLQMPHSSVQSYFKEQSFGKWALQISEDPVAKKSHRWPIGFVTTGFVRGSKKPIAGAICEAVSLAHLRQEQWNEMPVKQRRRELSLPALRKGTIMEGPIFGDAGFHQGWMIRGGCVESGFWSLMISLHL
ncbi:ribonucleases P/MRP protein subunit POP1 isoform X2 [Malania oleifera]|uniref:ribonucleases P/MRP protein subunit POP1 isoform X2 n=1 Tax=Malania oleifera TaxID=397392 RepID=UPI0025AE89DA|nr:ribonucleases P/MRP protein subunit POP1 isoform X2 [Malania oleifera]